MVGENTGAFFTTFCYEAEGQWHIGGTNDNEELSVVASGDEKYIFTKLDKLVRLKISLREQCGMYYIQELMEQLGEN